MDFAASVAASDYEGWLVYLDDGTPIFEAVRRDPKLISVVKGGVDTVERPVGRNCLEWKDLPHSRIARVEVYYRRGLADQPCFRVDRHPGQHAIRFLVTRKGGMVAYAGAQADPRDKQRTEGQHRLGFTGYQFVIWNPTTRDPDHMCQRYDIDRTKGVSRRPEVRLHPCAPKPFGFGYAPELFGLTAADVPRYRKELPRAV